MTSKYRLIPTRTAINRIGLLGGSFNPPHAGHLHLALNAYRILGLKQIIFLITPGSPLKQKIVYKSIEQRFQQVEDLISPYSNVIKTSSIELYLKTSYTSLNLEYIKKIHPFAEFVWIMGTDNLFEFHRWFKWQKIADFASVAAFARNHNELRAVESVAAQYMGGRPIILNNSDINQHLPPNPLPKLTIWSMTQLHISSSDIRRAPSPKSF